MIYLDHAALSPVPEGIGRKLLSDLSTIGFNPAAAHVQGLQARKALDDARGRLAAAMRCDPSRIVFTSGGTESNNLALHACCQQRRAPGTIWASATLHPSLYEPLRQLETRWDVHHMPMTTWGAIDPKQIEKLPDPDIVITEWVNNEVGFIQPVDALSACVAQRYPNAYLVVDGAQGFGKLSTPDLSRIAAFTASGHKLGAPVGIGLATLSPDLKITPLAHGGGQESGWRSGTVAVPLACAMANAVEKALGSTPPVMHFHSIDDTEAPNTHRHPQGQYSPYITLLDLQPVEGEVLLHHLESKGIILGTGSACSAHRKGLSEIHKAVGLSARESRCTLRWSSHPGQPEDELMHAWKELIATWRDLRRFYT